MTSNEQELTRDDLYALAAEREIAGRSSMSKAELGAALSERDGADAQRHPVSRVDDFRRLAAANARGEFTMLPRMLTGEDRRRHVRQTVREDHQTRIEIGRRGRRREVRQARRIGVLVLPRDRAAVLPRHGR